MAPKLKTHKFARKPFYVDAVRVSEDNIEAVAEWCRGEVVTDHPDGVHIKVRVHRPLTDRQKQAFIGDWVLFAGSGFKVYVPKAFDKSFEKVKTLTKAQADEAGIKVPHEPRPGNTRLGVVGGPPVNFKPNEKAPVRPVPTAPKKRHVPVNPVISEEQAHVVSEAIAEAHQDPEKVEWVEWDIDANRPMAETERLESESKKRDSVDDLIHEVLSQK